MTSTCPACGSNNLVEHIVEETAQLALGDEFKYSETILTCQSCGESGDFANQNINNYELAKTEAIKNQIPRLIEDLNRQSISMARFERAFELPGRTLSRWKDGDFSASSAALLRIAHALPFVIGIAENKFEPLYTRKTIFNEGVKIFNNEVSGLGGVAYKGFFQHPQYTSVSINGIFPVNGNTTLPDSEVKVAIGG